MRFMEQNVLQKLQSTMLDILKVFDLFCRENGLRYSLYSGTLLGAVRHGGFIPWDDDIDVCMSRADYDKFLALWEKNHPEGYVLQIKENSIYFDQSFSKIRKDHTTFLQDAREIGNHHTGIFLDIFPIDRIPNGFKRKKFVFDCMLYQLLTREFLPSKSSFPVRFFAFLVLKTVPKRKRKDFRNKILKKITRYDDCIEFETVSISCMEAIKHSFSSDMLEKYIEILFENEKFMCFANWDDNLRRMYGDYKVLPPEEERVWRHHPILIDFERNYDEIPDEEKIGLIVN